MKHLYKYWHAQIVFFIFSAIIVSPITITAQTEITTVKNKKLNGGFGHLNFSGEQLNLVNLNTFLSSNNYGKLNLNSVSFGGGGAYVINNFIVGGGGAWLSGSQTQNSVNSVDLEGGYGYFSFGYVVHSGKHSLLYPTLGIGGGGYSIIINKNNQQGDFSQQLNSPVGMTTLNAGGWMTNFQLTYQYFLSKKKLEGFCIGIKGGYKYSPYNWNTKMNNATVGNSPKINMNGFYLTLILGGGSASN